ncbi:hypothetical protein [Sphaerisporangium sp. TRM90804]|uniref:hypothetical protein n=1 Tax=Sphaerisporangium sp. TRM90804 TaxID=3031113 RepID=UPI00244B8A28|nr:hypothetical protein [Sphaerisporangium sp. TRM90804]MDH2428299.1 hypothetical protein [Sphaerisporangium sp. TRM90804]
MDDRSPLGDYLQTHIDRHHRGSRTAFTNLALDPETGNRLVAQWVIDLIRGRVSRTPEQWRLRALAKAMGSSGDVGEETERYRHHLTAIRRLVAAHWLGLEHPPARTDASVAEFAVPPHLPEAERRLVIRWAEMMARDLDRS